MIERRGRPVSRLNLSPSSHLLLFEIEAGSHPPAFRSANTALSSRFSICAGASPARGPVAGGSYSPFSDMRAALPPVVSLPILPEPHGAPV